jgi:hypothetical protein
MLIDYISNLEHAKDVCKNFEYQIVYIFSETGHAEEEFIPHFVSVRQYQKYLEPVRGCVKLCEMLKPESIKKYRSLFFNAASSLENANETKSIADFKKHLETLKICFRAMGSEVTTICSSFDGEEKERVNEALHDYFEDCNYSSVAMSVSAVESRLVKLMCLVNPDSEPELREKTLGQLISEYLENKEKYKKVVPKKHEHLLQLCNTYRTFSVHPKKERIRPTIAGSILNFTIEFLTDQDTKPEVVQAQLSA